MTDEQTRLRTVRERTAARHPTTWSIGDARVRVAAGSGAADDCAIVPIQGDCELVIGSDYIRGVKFKLYELGHLDYYDLGWYLVTANVSDVAAMGATPVGLLSVVRYPPELSDQEFDSIMAGIADACEAYGANPLGGDIGGAERLYLAASAFGFCEPGRALRRNGARPGDALVVTGPVGTPAAAMLYFDRGRPAGLRLPEEHEQVLLESWRRPAARVEAGVTLARAGASACQDVSDGLRDTIEQLCVSSGVGCVVEADAVPMEPAVSAVAELLEVDREALALGVSVDFELAAAIPAERLEEAVAAMESRGLAVHVIGRFTEEPDRLLRHASEAVPLPGASWTHAAEDPSGAILDATRRTTD